MSLKLNIDVYVKRVDETVQSTIESLKNVWIETGYQHDECERLLDNLVEKLHQVCTAELAAENQILEHVKQEVETKLDEYIALSAQLGKTIDRISPLKGKINAADKLAELEKLIMDTKAKVTKRQNILDAELVTISKLQTELGNNVDAMQTCAPSDLPLSDAKHQALCDLRKTLENEKQQRLDKMKSIISTCHTLMKELVIFEEEALQSSSFKYTHAIKKYTEQGAWDFGLRLEDISNLELEQESLAREKESRRKELASSGAEIARLWTLLRVSTAEREEFQKSFKMNLSLDTIRKGRVELARLMEVRGTSLARVVGSIRSDISVLWTELGVVKNEDKRRQFPGYFDSPDNLEDSAVEKHQAFFQELQVKVTKLRPLLQRIERREAIIQERIELEYLQMNPERLNNRGPNARDERKREEAMAAHVRNLEKLTQDIIVGVNAWEAEEGVLLYVGEPYLMRLEEQEAHYISLRDELRAARKAGKAVGKPLPSSKKSDNLSASLNNSGILSASLTSKQSSSVAQAKPSKSANAPKDTTSIAISVPSTKNAVHAPSFVAPTQDENERGNVSIVYASEADGEYEDDDLTLYTSATEVRATSSICTVRRETPL